MPKCSLLMNALGETQPLDESAKITVENIKNAWSAQGKRVILLARKAIPQSEIKSAPSSAPFESEVMEHARTGLTLVGLVGITDPPRPEIPEVVRTLRAAGIRIFMVGDLVRLRQASLLTKAGHGRFYSHCSGHCCRMWYHHQPTRASRRSLCFVSRWIRRFFEIPRIRLQGRRRCSMQIHRDQWAGTFGDERRSVEATLQV